MANIDSIFLISGNTDLLIDREIYELFNHLKTKNKTLEKQTIDAQDENSFNQLLEYISPNLFGNTSLIVIDEINVAEDKLDSKLVDFLKNIASENIDDNYLVVVHRGGAGGTGIVKALQKLKVKEIKCPSIKYSSEFIDFMKQEFKRHKRDIEEEALLALRDAVGENLDELVGAISQLCFDVVDKKIELGHVKKYYQGNVAVKVFDISNSLWDANYESAMKNLNDLLDQDNNSGVYIVTIIANSLRKLVKLASLPNSANDFQVAQEIGVSPKQVPYLRKQLRNWNQTSLANAVVELAKVDAYMRAGYEGTYLDQNQKRFLLETTVRKIALSAK
jgi:DNA polymerase-3 subunit delta